MEGKKKSKKKLIKTLLLAMSFVLTIVLTASITLAWFYDSDWANTTVTMAGSVGIEMRNTSNTATHGSGKFHFKLGNGATLAYPGQSIEVQANVFNNGGDSVKTWWKDQPGYDASTAPTPPAGTDISSSGKGSACYVRARFVVYTDIGIKLDETTTPKLSELYPIQTPPNINDAKYTDNLTQYDADVEQYKKYQEYLSDQNMGAQELYEALVKMITEVNNDATKSNGYNWVFWENTSPTMQLNGNPYFEGIQQEATDGDGGYFYLCYDNDASLGDGVTASTNLTLKPLTVGETAAFLWDGIFVIPWQLTNLSADKTIFIACEFQAIQTFIPLIADGKINGTLADNQLKPQFCYYDDVSVQTVFNSSRFTSKNDLSTDVNGKVYANDGNFVVASLPDDELTGTLYKSGTAQANATTKRNAS
jgi:hypothetical protein